MRIYIDRRLGDVHDVISLSETLVFVQEAYPDAVDYRPGARLPVDFRRLDESEVDKYTALSTNSRLRTNWTLPPSSLAT